MVDTRTDILVDTPGTSVGTIRVTGSSARDVVDAGESALRVHPRVDLLVHNASEASAQAPAATLDASMAFATTVAVLPGLQIARCPRIVTVTPHSDVPVNRTEVDDDAGQAGLNLIDFVALLHQVVTQADTRVRSIAVDPGPVPGVLGGASGPLLTRLGRRRDEREARPALVAATSPGIPSGHIVTPMYPRSGQTMNLPIGEPSQHAAHAWRRAELACHGSLSHDTLLLDRGRHRRGVAG